MTVARGLHLARWLLGPREQPGIHNSGSPLWLLPFGLVFGWGARQAQQLADRVATRTYSLAVREARRLSAERTTVALVAMAALLLFWLVCALRARRRSATPFTRGLPLGDRELFAFGLIFDWLPPFVMAAGLVGFASRGHRAAHLIIYAITLAVALVTSRSPAQEDATKAPSGWQKSLRGAGVAALLIPLVGSTWIPLAVVLAAVGALTAWAGMAPVHFHAPSQASARAVARARVEPRSASGPLKLWRLIMWPGLWLYLVAMAFLLAVGLLIRIPSIDITSTNAMLMLMSLIFVAANRLAGPMGATLALWPLPAAWARRVVLGTVAVLFALPCTFHLARAWLASNSNLRAQFAEGSYGCSEGAREDAGLCIERLRLDWGKLSGLFDRDGLAPADSIVITPRPKQRLAYAPAPFLLDAYRLHATRQAAAIACVGWSVAAIFMASGIALNARFRRKRQWGAWAGMVLAMPLVLLPVVFSHEGVTSGLLAAVMAGTSIILFASFQIACRLSPIARRLLTS